jgi:hypothetical protein
MYHLELLKDGQTEHPVLGIEAFISSVMANRLDRNIGTHTNTALSHHCETPESDNTVLVLIPMSLERLQLLRRSSFRQSSQP